MMEQARENERIRPSGGVVTNSDLVVERHLELTSRNRPASTAAACVPRQRMIRSVTRTQELDGWW
jgi:hypothetical protein